MSTEEIERNLTAGPQEGHSDQTHESSKGHIRLMIMIKPIAIDSKGVAMRDSLDMVNFSLLRGLGASLIRGIDDLLVSMGAAIA